MKYIVNKIDMSNQVKTAVAILDNVDVAKSYCDCKNKISKYTSYHYDFNELYDDSDILKILKSYETESL